ncbi:MAG: SIR2 family protein [Candidatus Treponema excrementipullorum]|nr:SIR2 family protein [Candidatus Treponema excrementipullorum]
MEKKVEDIKLRLEKGNCMLFCGAGFSLGAQNINKDCNHELVVASELARKICELGEMPLSENLRYVSDRFLKEKENLIPELVLLLKKMFTVKECSKSHKNICSYPWRRIYTTNYDNCIERALSVSDIAYDKVSITDPSYSKDNLQCVHINGYVENINKDSLINGKIKLSHSSYVSSSEFEQSRWYLTFKHDLEMSRTIVFVGYSMYDINVEKILFEGNYRDKTFFIVSEYENEEQEYLLNQYGAVLKIGVDKFGSQLGFFDRQNEELNKSFDLLSLIKYELKEPDKPIDDDAIRDFILQGNINQSYIDNFVASSPVRPYFVSRSMKDCILSKIYEQKNILIISEMGNGKSTLLRHLQSELSINGYDVYSVIEDNGKTKLDVEKIIKLNKKSIIFIDSYSLYFDFVKYLVSLNNEKIQFVLSDRSNLSDRYLGDLDNANIYLYSIDDLKDDELSGFVDIIDNIGFWNSDMIAYSEPKKKRYLKNYCDGTVSGILTKIFSAPQMKTRFEKLLNHLFVDPHIKVTVFSICILAVLDIPLDDSIISEVADNDIIYKAKLFNNQYFKELFKYKPNTKIICSSLWALFILRNFFDIAYTKEHLLRIAKKFDSSKKHSTIQESIFKSMLKFSFVERIFPEKDKLQIIKSYYDNLKVEIDWLKRDPHFWLQYGMAIIMTNNLDLTQRYFDNAYELAKQKPFEYDTRDIDMQQARLFFKRALNESDKNKIFDYLSKGVSLLQGYRNDKYKLRQLLLLEEIYDKKFKFFDQKFKREFVTICKNILNGIDEEKKENQNFYYEGYSSSIEIKFRNFVNKMGISDL